MTTRFDLDDLVRAQAMLKTYTGPVILVLMLYSLAYLPGLIANILYVREARRMEDIADANLPGVGCLHALLGLGLLILAAWMLIVFLVVFPFVHRLATP